RGKCTLLARRMNPSAPSFLVKPWTGSRGGGGPHRLGSTETRLEWLTHVEPSSRGAAKRRRTTTSATARAGREAKFARSGYKPWSWLAMPRLKTISEISDGEDPASPGPPI